MDPKELPEELNKILSDAMLELGNLGASIEMVSSIGKYIGAAFWEGRAFGREEGKQLALDTIEEKLKSL